MAHSGSPIRCRWSTFCWAVSRSDLPMGRPRHTRSTWPGCCSKTLRPRARSGPARCWISAAKPSAPNTVSPLPISPASGSRVTAAVERALDDRQREATEEVERILAAAVRVMERVAPEPPRVSDIVTEAGSSNKAFSRSSLHHQMPKERTAAGQVRRWVEGAPAQVADPHLISMSRAAAGQVSATTDWRAADDAIMRPMRELLIQPIVALGSHDARRDADAVFLCTVSAMRRYLDSAERPAAADVDHLVRFCLRGLGVC